MAGPLPATDATLATPPPFVEPDPSHSRPRANVGKRRRESVDRMRLLPRVFAFFVPAWSLFFVLDVYVALVVSEPTPLLWMASFRALGAAIVGTAWFLSRRLAPSAESVTVLELMAFVGASSCLSLIAVKYGGIASHYLPGLSCVVVVQTMALPSRWKRALVLSLADILTFPLIMAIAALVDDDIATQWKSAQTVAMFVQDYVLVGATALGAAVGGHLIFVARRELFQARQLGRYRLKARVGSGGMGEVWLAWDDALRRDVALKILARQASDRQLVRFEREALAASSLQSPHTIRVFDFGASDDGVWFIAMEFLEGADLAAIVTDHGPMPPARAVRFARHACASLLEAHEVGIVHRDIKPANLFVTRAGDQFDLLKLLDFGIAKNLADERDVQVTQAGFMAGTPAYMAPEVCTGVPADERSDIYSLGAVLYFLVCGSPPFPGENVAAVMLSQVHEEPETPSQRLGSLVPPDLENVILRCLDKNPDRRFKNVRDLDAALVRCAVGRAWTNDDARAFWLQRGSGPRLGSFAEMPTTERPLS
jgi:serine/threonine-protein kinase